MRNAKKPSIKTAMMVLGERLSPQPQGAVASVTMQTKTIADMELEIAGIENICGDGRPRFPTLRRECQGDTPTAHVWLSNHQTYNVGRVELPPEVLTKLGTKCRTINLYPWRRDGWVNECKGGCQGRGWIPSISLEKLMEAMPMYLMPPVPDTRDTMWKACVDHHECFDFHTRAPTPYEAALRAMYEALLENKLEA